MKQFTIYDIRGLWAPARSRRQAAPAWPAAALDACRQPGGILPANAASPCGCPSQPY